MNIVNMFWRDSLIYCFVNIYIDLNWYVIVFYKRVRRDILIIFNWGMFKNLLMVLENIFVYCFIIIVNLDIKNY